MLKVVYDVSGNNFVEVYRNSTYSTYNGELEIFKDGFVVSTVAQGKWVSATFLSDEEDDDE